MNFEYLKKYQDVKKLYDFCTEAESFVYTFPNVSVASARKAMEYIVKAIYTANISNEFLPSVFEMVTDVRFVNYISDDAMINSIHFIRKMGNIAAHDGNLNENDALDVLEELHYLVGDFSYMLGLIDKYPSFVKPSSKPVKAEPTKEIVKEKVEVNPELVAKLATRMRDVRFDTTHKRDEEENKKLYMKACLREAGWPIVSQANQAMPGCAGINMMIDSSDSVDYVLYGRDNKPLAIIEYTATRNNLIEGRTKGIEKANKLSVKYGYKPIVYYTNGYIIYVIDQLGYKPRRVFQFHSIEELELLKLRATIRQDISNPSIDDNITNRYYQKEAIRSACKAFSEYRRHSLLVMATGTGKTRIAISLVDILMKANWAKNILFLADRTSLVRQAHKNFNKLLPNVTTSIYAGSSFDRDPNARIIFSTYQTMIKLINDDTREFGIGRFDLIVVDEAHRSIFKKYGALFHYFDALMLGLTATPRSEDNKSTYKIFELKNKEPDYAYELEKAVSDGFLVGFHVEDKTTQALRRGIYYDDLSEEEKERFEDAFASGDEENDVDYSGTHIDVSKIKSTKFINLGTIDIMLNDLIKNGLRVEGNDKIGKTIIFSSSHTEAEYIVKRFLDLYPHLGSDFCKLIDSKVENSLNLIDNFTERGHMPQIAVSVDMMDTGIDAPDVLNLVFFKRVNSKIKFLQMIGRGTRLSPNVFGPGLNKTGFLIFDYFDNFNYFRTGNTWSTIDENKNGKSFTVKPQSFLIYQKKLDILYQLEKKNNLNPFDQQYMLELKNEFINGVRSLNNDDIEVQYNMSFVSKFRTAELWDSLSRDKVVDIEKHILPLLTPMDDPVKVKNYDLLLYTIEAEVPKREQQGKDIKKIRFGFGNAIKKIDDMLEELKKLKTIPEIVKKEDLINKMENSDYIFNNFSLETCEYVRKELRNLMSYIPEDKKYYVLDVKDILIDKAGSDSGLGKEKTYAERVNEYLSQTDPILAKITNLDELSDDEKNQLNDTFTNRLGTSADYAALSNNKPLLPWIRAQIGISDQAISTKFGSFLNNKVMNQQQLTYLNQIISYAKANGDIVFMDLQRVSPLCDVDVLSLFGDKIAYIKTLINGLHKPVM